MGSIFSQFNELCDMEREKIFFFNPQVTGLFIMNVMIDTKDS